MAHAWGSPDPNRYIANNIRQLLEIIEHYDKIKKNGLIFIADFEKTFDKLRWDLIYKCLEFFILGIPYYIGLKLYNNYASKVIDNGYLSKSIALSQGVKQGCPLYYIYLLWQLKYSLSKYDQIIYTV